MKRIFIATLITASAFSTFAWEGTVKQKFISDGNKTASVTVTWYLTDNNCKMQMDFDDSQVKSSSFFIPDLKNAQLLTYTVGGVTNVKHPVSSKTYSAIPLSTIQANADVNVSRVSVVKTGEIKSIQGMNCEKMIVKTNSSETQMWVTKDFKPDFYKFYSCFRSSLEIMALYEEKIQGFPLQSVTKDFSGKVISQYELIAATPAKLGAADFTVPEGYEKKQ